MFSYKPLLLTLLIFAQCFSLNAWQQAKINAGHGHSTPVANCPLCQNTLKEFMGKKEKPADCELCEKGVPHKHDTKDDSKHRHGEKATEKTCPLCELSQISKNSSDDKVVLALLQKNKTLKLQRQTQLQTLEKFRLEFELWLKELPETGSNSSDIIEQARLHRQSLTWNRHFSKHSAAILKTEKELLSLQQAILKERQRLKRESEIARLKKQLEDMRENMVQQALGNTPSKTESDTIGNITLKPNTYKIFTVQEDSTLRKIAAERGVYGDAEQANLIFKTNRDKIKKLTDIIPAGTSLIIPNLGTIDDAEEKTKP